MTAPLLHTLAAASERPLREFRLDGLPSGWWGLLSLLALVALCYLVVWMYRREGRAGAGRRLRIVLAGLRCLVILTLAAVWLNPVLATFIVRTVTARVVVLADASASMSVSDAATDAGPDGVRPSRAAQVRELLVGRDHAWLRRFAERNELAVYAFGDAPRQLRLPWAPGATAAEPRPTSEPTRFETPADLPTLATQNRTDVGQAVAAALEDLGESKLAGIVVITDGALNRGMSAEELAGYLRRYRAPVYAIGVGAPQEPPNARVTNVSGPATASRGDPFEIRVEVAAAGIEPTTTRLELTEERVDGAAPRRVIATRDVPLDGDRPPAVLTFRIPADAPGEFAYTARIAPVPDEAVLHDNARFTNVTVAESRTRVLIIAGRPTYDYRAVERLLERDQTIEVSPWLQSADANAIRDGDPGAQLVELPRKPEQIFGYDAILLLDPNPAELDASLAILLRRFVDEFGGGLLLQAGSQYTTRFLKDPRLADLVAILPITPEPDADVRLSEEGAFRTTPYPFELPNETRGHPLVQLHADETVNRAVWAALPGAWWHLPVQREKPLAAVPLRHGGATQRTAAGGAPLLAAQPFGAGRTGFMAFDTTWRWRGTAENYFNRYWIQLVRYLAQTRLAGGNKRGAITLDRDAVNVGESVRIEARVLDETFGPWSEPTIEAFIEPADAPPRQISLSAVPGREGWFAGRMNADHEGATIIRIPLPGAAAATQPNAPEHNLRKFLRVNRPDFEMRSLRLHETGLRRLAEDTGGRYVALADAGAVPDWIEKAAEVTPLAGPKQELWDRTWLMALLAALLGVEWTLRRRNHLL